MRIGIDARALSGRKTGDRTYWRGLIGGLASAEGDHEYVLYLQRPVEGALPKGLDGRFSWRTIPEPANSALWMLRAFPKALRRDCIDVAHTQYNIPLFGSPCPVVTTVHDITYALFPKLFLPRDRWILNGLMPLSMSRAAHVIADSESTRHDILKRYSHVLAADKVSSILLAADSLFQPPQGGQERARKAVNNRCGLDDRPYVLAVGVLQPRKNLSMLIDCFAQLQEASCPPPHRLAVVGKRGWKSEDLDKQLKSLPAVTRDKIYFAGYVDDMDLPQLYGGADAFCYPSLYEGFGLPPLEAMACGCPVLCSNTSSLPEVVGSAGILLAPADAAAWAAALLSVLMDPLQNQRLRDAGPARAAQFSWNRTALQTVTVYDSIGNKL